ncbi:unnamed protein product [Discosporangium mesarthrocarpum]
MKSFAAAATLCALAPASAFVPSTPLTNVKVNAKTTMMAKAPAATAPTRSIAIPFDPQPEGLDGSMVGDVGFDPAGFANNPPAWANGLKWYREAELAHGRVAMLATVGWLFPEVYHFPGNAALGQDIFAEKNPLVAYDNIPGGGGFAVIIGLFLLEVIRLNRSIRGDGPAGDIGLGQGEGRWNPFNFNYSEEEYKEKQLQELKHGRAAMIGILGMYFQTKVAGAGIVTQLAEQFSLPDAVGKAGYYFPEGEIESFLFSDSTVLDVTILSNSVTPR